MVMLPYRYGHKLLSTTGETYSVIVPSHLVIYVFILLCGNKRTQDLIIKTHITMNFGNYQDSSSLFFSCSDLDDNIDNDIYLSILEKEDEGN